MNKALQDLPAARDRLLQAAADLLIARETIEISLAEIATQSGLNTALVKYYFGSKAGLLRALLQRDAGDALTQMHELQHLPLPSVKKLRLHLRGIMNVYRRAPYLNRLLGTLMAESQGAALQDLHQTFVRPVLDCQRSLLEQGAKTGEFREVDPILFYLAAIGACDQFLLSERMYRLSTGQTPEPDFSSKTMAFVEDMVMASLTPTS